MSVACYCPSLLVCLAFPHSLLVLQGQVQAASGEKDSVDVAMNFGALVIRSPASVDPDADAAGVDEGQDLNLLKAVLAFGCVALFPLPPILLSCED
jgi:hypothetical protein